MKHQFVSRLLIDKGISQKILDRKHGNKIAACRTKNEREKEIKKGW